MNSTVKKFPDDGAVFDFQDKEGDFSCVFISSAVLDKPFEKINSVEDEYSDDGDDSVEAVVRRLPDCAQWLAPR